LHKILLVGTEKRAHGGCHVKYNVVDVWTYMFSITCIPTKFQPGILKVRIMDSKLIVFPLGIMALEPFHTCAKVHDRWFSSKGYTSDMVSHNLLQLYVLEVSLTQFSQTLNIIYSLPCRNSCGFFIHDTFIGPSRPINTQTRSRGPWKSSKGHAMGNKILSLQLMVSQA
jgi:hypothetical protein